MAKHAEYNRAEEWTRYGFSRPDADGNRTHRCDFTVKVRHWVAPVYDSVFGDRAGPHRWGVYIRIFAVSPIGPVAIAEGQEYVSDWPGHWSCSYFQKTHDETGAVQSVEFGWDFEHYNDSHGNFDVDDCAIFLAVADRIYDRAVTEITKALEV